MDFCASDRAAYEKLGVYAPLEIPKGWTWCRLEDLCYSISDGDHQAPPQEPSGIPFLVISDVSDGMLDFSNTRFVGQDYFDSIIPSRVPSNGDMLITVTGSYGIVVRVNTNRPFCFQRHIALLKCDAAQSEYVFYALQSSNAKRYFDAVATGTAQKTVALNHLRATPIPLPPINEQKKIVTCIEELFNVADSLGEAADGLDAASKRLDKKILDLAIHGKLVPQNPNDEPASELLRHIAATSHKSPCKNHGTETETTFEIPCGWTWCRLDEISLSIGNKNNQILVKEIRETGKWAVVSQGQNLIDGYSDFDEKAIEDLPIILFGDHTRNVKYLDFPFIVGADGAKLLKPLVEGKWLYYWMFYGASKIRNRGYARHWNEISKLPVPLPPIAEQKRIVAKIEELRKATQALTM